MFVLRGYMVRTCRYLYRHQQYRHIGTFFQYRHIGYRQRFSVPILPNLNPENIGVSATINIGVSAYRQNCHRLTGKSYVFPVTRPTLQKGVWPYIFFFLIFFFNKITSQSSLIIKGTKKNIWIKKIFPDRPTLFFGDHLLPETHNFFYLAISARP